MDLYLEEKKNNKNTVFLFMNVRVLCDTAITVVIIKIKIKVK